MKYLARLLLLAVVAAILGMGALGLFARGEQSEGRSLARWVLFEMRRTEALQERATMVSTSMEAKKAIIADLVAERLTLREAAKQFRAANDIVENDGGDLLATYRLPQTDEELCQQVIVWVKAELAAHPRQTARAVHRLEKELTLLPSSPDPIQ
jgi:hypothetical protein